MVEIIVIVLLILVNGVFAMTEIALISASKARLTRRAEEGSQAAALALRLRENPERFLSTVQVGITVVGVLAGAFGGARLSPHLVPVLEKVPGLAGHAAEISFGLVVVVISYISLVIGELVPKGLALRFPEAIAAGMARPMQILSMAAKPVVGFLEMSTRLVLRLAGHQETESGPSVAEVEVILREGIVTGTVQPEESEMVEGVFDLREVLAEEIMQPRPSVLFLPHDATPESYGPEVTASRQSVFPVYQDHRDTILGLVSLRALFANLADGDPKPLREFCAEPLFVSETQPALSLLETLRRSPLGAALVADEFGTVRGLITVEDLVEEIVGDLRPADLRAGEPAIRATAEGEWLADGLIAVDQVEVVIEGFAELAEAEKEPFQTLAGYIVHRLDRLPTEGERFVAGDFELEILDMDRQRIDKVAIRRLPPGEAPGAPSEPAVPVDESP